MEQTLMRVLGIAVDYNKRLTLRAVILEHDRSGAVAVVDKSSVPVSVEDGLATQLHELFGAVTAKMQSFRPDAVVIRRADRSQRGNNLEGPRLRLMAEGAASVAARQYCPETHVRAGQECASIFGRTRDELDAEALVFVPRALGFACAAALSAMN